MVVSAFAALASDGESDAESDQTDVEAKSGQQLAARQRLDAEESEYSYSEDDEDDVEAVMRDAAAADARMASSGMHSGCMDDFDFDGTDAGLQRLRIKRGIVLRRFPDGDPPEPDLYQPVLRFSDLASRGVPDTLIAACRACARGAEWTSPIQSECWGLLLSSGGATASTATPAPQATCVATEGLRPEDIPVPDSDDEDLEELGADVCPATAAARCCAARPADTGGQGELSCVVRGDVDVIGVAPTGSGKTLAFLLPVLADGLCSRPREVLSAASAFDAFSELFGRSFALGKGQNEAVIARLRKILDGGDVPALKVALNQVAAKAAASPGPAAAEWRGFRDSLESVGLLELAVLVLSPTRELAQQVGEVAVALGAACAVVVGGVDHVQQRQALLRDAPAAVVATPGRLLALCGQWPSSSRSRHEEKLQADPEAIIRLRRVTRLVLDEADRLLDEGFEEDIRELSRLTSARDQTMMFSATWNPKTESLAASLRPGALHVTVTGVPLAISQKVELLPKAARGRRLRDILGSLRGGAKVLIFVLFKKEAKELAKMLASEGVTAWALEGSMSQASRFTAMQSFRHASSARGASPAVLVATDVAARGLDVPDVSHVINFSFGLSQESYVHRIGRCGRAGQRGEAYTFLTEGDERFAASLLKVLQQAGQPVPNGLADMAKQYETCGANTKLSVTYGMDGEAKVVKKGGRKQRPE